MRFAVLGPLEVSHNGGPVSVGGRKQRILLAMLLLRPNERVARGQLVEALWGERPPRSAAESLDAYVYRLRKLLGHDRLVRDAGGYALRVEPGELDVDQFERLVGTAGLAEETGDHDAAAAALAEALALWRGSPWSDMLDEPLAGEEARRLEELRLTALETRVEADLAVGHGAELVPELERLVSEHPLRERLVCGLMLALYRAGRQTDALDAFQAARRVLVEELGLEPGPQLHELQRRILQHDPTLGEPRRVVSARGLAPHRTLAAVAALVLAAIIGVWLVVGSGRAHPARALAAGSNGLLSVNPGSGAVATATPLTGSPAALATGAGSVWVADPGSGTLSRIDPRSGVVVDRIQVGGDPGSIVSGDGAIWVASTVGATVVRIDSSTETVTQTIALPGSNPDALAFGDGRLWVADSAARELFAINPANGLLTRTLPLDVQPSAVAFADAAIWVAGYNDATVEKIDPATGRAIGRVRVGDGPVALALESGALWVANSLDSTVSRIDLATLTINGTIPVGSGPSALAVGAGSVWVADQYSGSVSRLDPRRNRVASVDVGGAPTSLTVAMGRLWVGVGANGGIHRGGTLQLLSTQTFGSVDPAFFQQAEPPEFDGLAYDTLVTFQHTGGSDGLRLVPDLAVALPIPTDMGTTYAFRVRPHLRYSDDQPLLASDFRRAIERLFRVGSPGSDYFTGLVGAGKCEQQPAGCNLSSGIVTDDAAGTLVFHLTVPDPEFLFKLTEQDFSAPIPPGTPDHEAGSRTPPGTGPYRIAAVTSTEVRFVRNAFFREWSHAAQPDGNPDVIVWRHMPSQHAAVTAIERRRGDWLWGLIPTPEYRELQLQSPAQLHSNAQFDVDFIPLNTHRAPFNDIRVRQALNYAIDRNKIARMYGGPSFATPTCQPLAPGLPGYVRYCPYTLHPRPDGIWNGPDRPKAERLIAASGTRGERVDVWGASYGTIVPKAVPAYIARVLRSLGYRVRLRLDPFATTTDAMRRRHQLSVDGDWLADYPDPSSYIPQFLSCVGGNGNGYYCNPRIDREMSAATLLDLNAHGKAAAVWASIDQQLTNTAAWIPTVTLRDVELVSSRLRNYQYNPLWGFLADQAWVR